MARVTTDSRHPFPVAANVLARQFTAPAPDAVWVTDITYIPTGEGWLYLTVILDLCSRGIVGWALSERITRQLTLDSLGMARGRRRPPRGLLHHSDRGSQSVRQRRLPDGPRPPGIVCSMSRRGDGWVELVHDALCPTRAAARGAVFEYIEVFYNRQPRHSSLGFLSPVAFERQWHQQHRAA